MANEHSTLTIVLPIATGLGGYLGGILSEPVKQWAKSYVDRRAMRIIVYDELSSNADTFLMIETNRDKEYSFEVAKGTLDVNLNFKNFEYAESQPLLFHQLKEAGHIRSLYAGIRHFLKTCTCRTDIVEVADLFKCKLREGITEGDIQRRHLRTHGRPYLEEFVNKLSK